MEEIMNNETVDVLAGIEPVVEDTAFNDVEMVSSSEEGGISLGEGALIGLAAAGAVAVGYGAYKGGKWVVNKVKGFFDKKKTSSEDGETDSSSEKEETVEEAAE